MSNGTSHSGEVLSGQDRPEHSEYGEIRIRDVLKDIDRILKGDFRQIVWLGIKATFYLWLVYLILVFIYFTLEEFTGETVALWICGFFAGWNVIVLFSSFARTATSLPQSGFEKTGSLAKWFGQSVILSCILFLLFVGLWEFLPFWHSLIKPIARPYLESGLIAVESRQISMDLTGQSIGVALGVQAISILYIPLLFMMLPAPGFSFVFLALVFGRSLQPVLPKDVFPDPPID